MRRVITFGAESQLDLDHVRTCDFCRATYHVILRFWGSAGREHSGSLSKRRAAQLREEVSAGAKMEAASKSPLARNVYHRCTQCGQYDFLQQHKMESGYKRYCNGNRLMVGCFGMAALFIGAPTLLGIWAAIWENNGVGAGLLFSFLPIGAGVWLWRLIRRTWPISAGVFRSKLNAINASDLVTKWLSEWHSESPLLIAELQRNPTRETWLKLADLQHRYDPFPFYWVTENIESVVKAMVGTEGYLPRGSDLRRPEN